MTPDKGLPEDQPGLKLCPSFFHRSFQCPPPSLLLSSPCSEKKGLSFLSSSQVDEWSFLSSSQMDEWSFLSSQKEGRSFLLSSHKGGQCFLASSKMDGWSFLSSSQIQGPNFLSSSQMDGGVFLSSSDCCKNPNDSIFFCSCDFLLSPFSTSFLPPIIPSVLPSFCHTSSRLKESQLTHTHAHTASHSHTL